MMRSSTQLQNLVVAFVVTVTIYNCKPYNLFRLFLFIYSFFNLQLPYSTPPQRLNDQTICHKYFSSSRYLISINSSLATCLFFFAVWTFLSTFSYNSTFFIPPFLVSFSSSEYVRFFLFPAPISCIYPNLQEYLPLSMKIYLLSFYW